MQTGKESTTGCDGPRGLAGIGLVSGIGARSPGGAGSSCEDAGAPRIIAPRPFFGPDPKAGGVPAYTARHLLAWGAVLFFVVTSLSLRFP